MDGGSDTQMGPASEAPPGTLLRALATWLWACSLWACNCGLNCGCLRLQRVSVVNNGPLLWRSAISSSRCREGETPVGDLSTIDCAAPCGSTRTRTARHNTNRNMYRTGVSESVLKRRWRECDNSKSLSHSAPRAPASRKPPTHYTWLRGLPCLGVPYLGVPGREPAGADQVQPP